MPRQFIETWVAAVQKKLQKEIKSKKILNPELSIVFISKIEMKKLNNKHRKKNYATDVLSFGSLTDLNSIPELVISPEVIKLQAKDHNLSFKMELGYMILHGILHLLGFDHEKGPKKAKEMFDLQDKIFDHLKGTAFFLV